MLVKHNNCSVAISYYKYQSTKQLKYSNYVKATLAPIIHVRMFPSPPCLIGYGEFNYSQLTSYIATMHYTKRLLTLSLSRNWYSLYSYVGFEIEFY